MDADRQLASQLTETQRCVVKFQDWGNVINRPATPKVRRTIHNHGHLAPSPKTKSISICRCEWSEKFLWKWSERRLSLKLLELSLKFISIASSFATKVPHHLAKKAPNKISRFLHEIDSILIYWTSYICLTKEVNVLVWRGVKAYTLSRSRQELDNADVIAEIGDDTAEKEPLGSFSEIGTPKQQLACSWSSRTGPSKYYAAHAGAQLASNELA